MSCPYEVDKAVGEYFDARGEYPEYVRMGARAYSKYLGCLASWKGPTSSCSWEVPIQDKRIFQNYVEIIKDTTLELDEVLAHGEKK